MFWVILSILMTIHCAYMYIKRLTASCVPGACGVFVLMHTSTYAHLNCVKQWLHYLQWKQIQSRHFPGQTWPHYPQLGWIIWLKGTSISSVCLWKASNVRYARVLRWGWRLFLFLWCYLLTQPHSVCICTHIQNISVCRCVCSEPSILLYLVNSCLI